MAFFAQTGPTAEARLSQQLGQAIGQGINKNFVDPQTIANEKRLSAAFSQISPNSTPGELLKILGPTFMTTPGGAQLLESFIQNQYRQGAINAQKNVYGGYDSPQQTQNINGSQENGAVQKSNAPVNMQNQPTGQRGQNVLGNQPLGQTEDNRFQSNIPGYQPIPSAEERHMEALKLSEEMRVPLDVTKPIVEQKYQGITADNNRALQEYGQRQQIRNNELNNIYESANKANIFPKIGTELKYPQDQTLYKGLVEKNYIPEDPLKTQELATAEYRKVQDIRNNITRAYKLPLTKGLDNRSVSDIKKGLQPKIEEYRALVGDVIADDQLRNMFQFDLGMGPVDVEDTLYPSTPDQNKLYNSIKPVKNYTSQIEPKFGISVEEKEKIKGNRLGGLVEDLTRILNEDPQANLLNLRDKAMSKNYTWEEVAEAMDYLQQNKLFSPSPKQQVPFTLIHNNPTILLRGLNQIFKGSR